MTENNFWRERISRHDFIIDGALTHPFESIHLGSGELGASVNIYPHEIKIVLGKADVWDARLEAYPETDILPHDELINMMAEKDRDLKAGWNFDPKDNEHDFYNGRLGGLFRRPPNPKRAGCIRLYHPGLSNTKVTTRVRLSDGTLETKFIFTKGILTVNAFAERGFNRFWINAHAKGQIPWFALVLEKEPDDSDNTLPLPVIQRETEYLTTISQTIPGGFDIDEFTWHLAARFPQSGAGVDAAYVEHHYAWRVRQYCSLADGASASFCVAAATDRDGFDLSQMPALSDSVLFESTEETPSVFLCKEETPSVFLCKEETLSSRKRALLLASPKSSFEKIYASHQKAWGEFWDASNIALDDAELESVWYRNHFGYGCALRPGMTTLGSGGNVVVQDVIPWHGTCHLNHNFQKWYCTALATNHAEWIDIYAAFVNRTMPVFEKHARLIFGLDGVYVDLAYFPIMSHKHFDTSNFMGRALALTGWLGQPLWNHYEYTRDLDWLRENGYCFLKQAAVFYYNYMEKYGSESGEIYPSIRLEEPDGFMRGFVGNRNVITDLCMFKKAFDRALSAAEALGTDEEWQKKWREARKKVPPIEHGVDENGEGWVALDKHHPLKEPAVRADTARHSRWGGGGWIVFPGEYIDGDGGDTLTSAMRLMIEQTDLQNPFTSSVTEKNMYPGVPIIHPISSVVPSIRLCVEKHFEPIRKILLEHRLTYGQFSSYRLSAGEMPPEVLGNSGYLWYDWRSVENKYIGVMAVTEMLLQSQGGVIRLFPFWLSDKDASFNNFRAAGGFAVSASKRGKIIEAEILSLCGETARVKCLSGNFYVSCGGKKITAALENGTAVFKTVANKTYSCVINL
ncbi:MAG: hypothetical protein FWE82_01340 [Defluviitaleaceae bacterium]|nr:hypothetical protein [Defluviitaleaceae bacterium]